MQFSGNFYNGTVDYFWYVIWIFIWIKEFLKDFFIIASNIGDVGHWWKYALSQ